MLEEDLLKLQRVGESHPILREAEVGDPRRPRSHVDAHWHVQLLSQSPVGCHARIDRRQTVILNGDLGYGFELTGAMELSKLLNTGRRGCAGYPYSRNEPFGHDRL